MEDQVNIGCRRPYHPAALHSAFWYTRGLPNLRGLPEWMSIPYCCCVWLFMQRREPGLKRVFSVQARFSGYESFTGHVWAS